MNRRAFLSASALSAVVPALSGAAAPAGRLGIDLFSLRSQGWSPFEYVEYCSKQKAHVVFFSEIRFLGSLEESHLQKVRRRAEELDLRIEFGNTSICPSSKRFAASQGTAEEQLTRWIQAARTLGSPIVRCFLGTSEDRKGPLPIEGHIENTVKVLRAVRSRALDAGVRIAVENHAGDMQARELKMLIEEAGKDFVGAVVDSGNSVWALEDPHLTLEVLAPYALTSGVRDSALWRVPEGVAVEWVRMGEGNVGIEAWCRRFLELCPGKTLALEIICIPARTYAVFDPNFWKGYEGVQAAEFARFLALAEKGKPKPPAAPVPKDQVAAREREDLEASVRFCHEVLGI